MRCRSPSLLHSCASPGAHSMGVSATTMAGMQRAALLTFGLLQAAAAALPCGLASKVNVRFPPLTIRPRSTKCCCMLLYPTAVRHPWSPRTCARSSDTGVLTPPLMPNRRGLVGLHEACIHQFQLFHGEFVQPPSGKAYAQQPRPFPCQCVRTQIPTCDHREVGAAVLHLMLCWYDRAWAPDKEDFEQGSQPTTARRLLDQEADAPGMAVQEIGNLRGGWQTIDIRLFSTRPMQLSQLAAS